MTAKKVKLYLNYTWVKSMFLVIVANMIENILGVF